MESVLIEKEVGMIHNDDQCQSFSELHVSVKRTVICNKVDTNCPCKLYRHVMPIELKCF